MDLIFNFVSGQKQIDEVQAWLKAGSVQKADGSKLIDINDS